MSLSIDAILGFWMLLRPLAQSITSLESPNTCSFVKFFSLVVSRRVQSVISSALLFVLRLLANIRYGCSGCD
jgi:hypothetical protein